MAILRWSSRTRNTFIDNLCHAGVCPVQIIWLLTQSDFRDTSSLMIDCLKSSIQCSWLEACPQVNSRTLLFLQEDICRVDLKVWIISIIHLWWLWPTLSESQNLLLQTCLCKSVRAVPTWILINIMHIWTFWFTFKTVLFCTWNHWL